MYLLSGPLKESLGCFFIPLNILTIIHAATTYVGLENKLVLCHWCTLT